MSLRTIISIAVSVVIGLACIAIGSTGTFARDHQMNNLHKGSHHHAVNHGRSAHPGSTKAAPTASR